MTKIGDREKLKFIDNAITAFDFLITDYDFTLSEQNERFVKFESANVVAVIYHGRLSYEIVFGCGLKNSPEIRLYQLPVILKALDANIPKTERGFYQAHKTEAIKVSLDKLSDLVRLFCGSLLKGDKEAYRVVDLYEQKESELLTQHYSLSHKRKEVEIAWDNQNYGLVKSLYESFEPKLTTLEQRRLEYVKKKSKLKNL